MDLSIKSCWTERCCLLFLSFRDFLGNIMTLHSSRCGRWLRHGSICHLTDTDGAGSRLSSSWLGIVSLQLRWRGRGGRRVLRRRRPHPAKLLLLVLRVVAVLWHELALVLAELGITETSCARLGLELRVLLT